MSEKYKNRYRIESNRWQNWDYSAAGLYFVTICIQGRDCILGQIVDGTMQLSAYGEIVKHEFLKMNDYNQRATIDEWVIMPNHVHCIIALGEYNNSDIVDGGIAVEKIHEFSPDRINCNIETEKNCENNFEKIHETNTEKIREFSLQSEPATKSQTETDIKQYRRLRRNMVIPMMIGKFQMQTSKQINILRNSAGQKTWQTNYHDHVIRDNAEYQRIKQYIIYNPLQWNTDTYNDCK